MSRKSIDVTTGKGIPQLHCVIPATGGKAGPIWRPRYGAYQSSVITIHTNQTTDTGMPYMHIVVARGDVLHIVVARGDVLRIGGPGHSVDLGGMAAIDVDIVTVGGVPYSHFRVETARGDAAAIGRPGDVNHSKTMTLIGKHIAPSGRIPPLHRVI